MIPTLGRGVIAVNVQSNGANEHFAFITRVWSANADTRDGPCAVNLCVFADMAGTVVKSSVMLYDTRQEAEAALASQFRPGPCVAFWPDRMPAPDPAAALALAA